jgi:hypothetical protein
VTRSAADLGIGALLTEPGLTWIPFHGRIDEISLFEEALAEDEIERLYITVSTPGPIGRRTATPSTSPAAATMDPW